MSEDQQPEGAVPQPARVPHPTYWPFVMAFSICFGLWGVLTAPSIILVGLAGFLLAAVCWTAEVRREHQD